MGVCPAPRSSSTVPSGVDAPLGSSPLPDTKTPRATPCAVAVPAKIRTATANQCLKGTPESALPVSADFITALISLQHESVEGNKKGPEEEPRGLELRK